MTQSPTDQPQINAHVLVVDDDPKFTGFVSSGLVDCGYRCSIAQSPSEAEKVLAESQTLDLILLDVMMPERSGWDFLEELRATGSEIPVIFVTARDAVDERVRGLGLGADDYIIKPFAFQELLARIQAVLRRRQAVPVLRHSGLVLDPATRRVTQDEKRIELTPKEFDLLRSLLDAHGAVLSRSFLLETIWGIDFDPGTNVVDVCIARLRRRLKQAECVRIETVVGEGYHIPPPEPGS